MSRQQTARLALPEPNLRSPTLTADEFVKAVVAKMLSDDRRAVPFYRISELSPPFSRSWVKRRIAEGDLEAVRIFGVVLIPEASLRALLASATTWEPADCGDGGA